MNTMNRPPKLKAPEKRISKSVSSSKPEIPDDILRKWLEEKINLSSLKDVSQVRAGFLWEKGGIERYRINVWQEAYRENRICPDIRIIHSFFVFYYPKEKSIVDKTLEPKPKKKGFFDD